MKVRVYYEDTDAAGVVYHAGYLRFFERARTEFFRDHGFNVAELAAAGNVFPVVRMEIEFKAPALHDDLLEIITLPEECRGASILIHQQAVRACDHKLLVEARVTLACIGRDQAARRIPPQIRNMLLQQLSGQ